MCKCHTDNIKVLYDDNDGDYAIQCMKCGEIIENGIVTKKGKDNDKNKKRK